jgi:Porin subfamily
MMRVTKLGIIAALGGSTAALAMLTGLAGARADDLQANQRLLDTRIDQLAAVGLQPGYGAVFSVDQNSAAGAPATAGSFPRSILIPGTDTSIKISGQITLAIEYIMSGGNPNASLPNSDQGDNGQLQSIPLHGSGVATSRGNGIFQMTPQESKIGFETRTPTPFGEARTVVDWDFNNGNGFVPGGADPQSVSDSRAPRLKYAYGTLGGLLAGQAASNFADGDANGETLDQGGNFGEPGHVRIPQVRYTMPAWWGGSFSVSAESPETDVAGAAGIFASDAGFTTVTTSCPLPAVPAGGAAVAASTITCSSTAQSSGQLPVNVAKTVAPDLTAAWYLPQPWGHLDFSAVVRPGLDVTDGKYFAKDYVGYGGHFGMDVKPGWFGWAKDDFIFHIVGGNGIGSYINSSSSAALATNYGTAGTYNTFNAPAAAGTAAAAALIHFKTIGEVGGEIGYQHWWLDNLRSNVNAGMEFINIPAVNYVGVGSTLNKQLMSAHANLIWNPVSSVDIGLEYLWGQRQTVSNANGQYNALISKFNFRF